jgi:UTP-glucose-1-phosphate uridylyltransferase
VEKRLGGDREIIIIVRRTIYHIRNFLCEQISTKITTNSLIISRNTYRLLEIGRRVKFAIQEVQEGFGHAVYAAREAVGDEPFLLMLGDHIYRSNNEKGCAGQLLDAYQLHGQSMVGLRRTPEEIIGNFGTITGVWLQDGRLLNVRIC